MCSAVVRTRLSTLCAGVALAMGVLGVSPPGARASSAATASAATVFSTGSQTVAAFSIAPDGRVFYVGPQSNRIFVWSPTTGRTTTFATVTGGQGGFGITLSPAFAVDHLLYAYIDMTTGSGNHERLLRYTDDGSFGRNVKLLRDVGPSGTDHKGGKLLFSPDGKQLFLIVGDGGDPATSQDPAVDHGKVLRLTPLGAAAPNNPGFADPAVWATGLRNSIGMAFDPRTGRLWETENGPECNDEINRISGGRNYGWGPNEVCDGTARGTNQDGAGPVQPEENIASVVAPTGMTFCSGCGVTGLGGALVYGRYLTKDLRKVTLDVTRQHVVSDRLVYQDSSGVLAVESSPVDGSIWFADVGHGMKKLR